MFDFLFTVAGMAFIAFNIAGALVTLYNLGLFVYSMIKLGRN